MSNSTKSGILWTGAEKALIYGVSFVQSIILARLLSPGDFGLTAMLGIFLGLAGCMAESGLGTALVVSRQLLVVSLERRVLRWNVGIAGVMYVVLAIAAPGIAAWYGKPILRELMWAMALGMVIGSASSVAYARLTREQRFDRIAWVNSISTVVSSCVAIAMAWWGCGVWSIVGLGLANAMLRTSLAWGMSRRFEAPPHGASANTPYPFARTSQTSAHPNSNDIDNRAAFRQLLNYGWKLMLSGIIHTFYTESYNLVIGKMWSPAAVGLFVRGKRWAGLPGEVVNDTVGRVALPKLVGSRELEVGSWKWGLASKFTMLNAVLLWPCLVVLGIWAPEIVKFVLGAKWLDCVPYMRILLVGQFFWVFGNIALVKIRASGHSEVILKTDAWKKPIGIVLLVCGIPFGVLGLCWASVANSVVEATVDVWYARKVGSRE